jgi:hypothetical protein
MQLLFSGARPGKDDFRGVTAVLGVLDPESGEVLHETEYRTPDGLRTPAQKMQFTGTAWSGQRLYACCHTEIVWFDDWPPLEPAGRVSLPGFNDLHHCLPWGDGLAVANTGLETVDQVSLDGELLGRRDLLVEFPDARTIDPQAEYRRLDDTKPHLVHANHLFVRNGELWVTQLRASRAVQVEGEGQVSFEAGMPHDGRFIRDRLVFTTTNGHVVEVDPESMRVLASHDLTAMTPGVNVLGWCRGVCEDPRDPSSFFVAFSFPRPTRWREYAFRLKHGGERSPSRIACYDVGRGRMRESHVVTPEQNLILFQIDVLGEDRWI